MERVFLTFLFFLLFMFFILLFPLSPIKHRMRFIILNLNFSAAYKHADGKKIDGKRVLVDVERARTVKGWLPRRLGKFHLICY